MTPEAEQVLAYFRQEYWPHEQRSVNTVELCRRVSGSGVAIQELRQAGMVTQSLDQTFVRLTDEGLRVLGLSEAG